MCIEITDPTTDPAWNDKILSFPLASVFHTAEWARVLKAAYGYEPVYIVEAGNGQPNGVLPLFHVESFLTGRRGVSIPFTDVCPPLARDGGVLERLMNKAVEVGRARRWKTIELRGAAAFTDPGPADPSGRFLGHELNLDRPYADIAAGYRSSTRRNIRKAKTAGVAVETGRTLEAVHDFCRLNCITRRDHGLPPQPFSFFRALQAHALETGLGMIVLARHEGNPVAGAVFLRFNGRAVYKYGASDKRFQHLRANNLVMDEGIRRLSETGCKTLHFGRTDPHHEGLRRFKRGWGATESGIEYFKFDPNTQRYLQDTRGPKTSYPVFEKMPMPLLKLTGQMLYRHIG